MTVIFINNVAVELPPRFKEGDVCDEVAARVLQDILMSRTKVYLRWLLDNNKITNLELQDKADEIAWEELSLSDLDDDAFDPITLEAISIARELIVKNLAKDGLMPPKGIDMHAKALVDAMPELKDRAKVRIELRHKEAMAALGV